jgi:hypothetical protein
MKNTSSGTSSGQQEDFFQQLFSNKAATLADAVKKTKWTRHLVLALVNAGLRCLKHNRKLAADGAAPTNTPMSQPKMARHMSPWMATYSSDGKVSKKFFQLERNARRFAAQQPSPGPARNNS